MLQKEVAVMGGSVGFLMIPPLLWAYATGISAGDAIVEMDAATLTCKNILRPLGFRR